MPGSDERDSILRRAVGGALDATVGRAGTAARGIGDAAARDIVTDLEPFLIEETVPRLIEGLTPLLVERVVPEVIDGVTPLLVEKVVPEVVDGVTPLLVERVAPDVIDGVTPHLVAVTVPQVVDGVTPEIVDRVVPQVISGVTPMLVQETLPNVLDELTPYLVAQLAPRLIDGLMPKIHEDIVPAILDDIVDDPRVRALVREQSQGLLLDGLERLRRVLARMDDVVESIVRRIFRRPKRAVPESTDLVMPGRRFPNAGIVTRVAGMALDFATASLLFSLSVTALLTVLDAIFKPVPDALAGVVAIAGFLLFPWYFAVPWSLTGRTPADAIVGLRLTRRGARRLHFGRALGRAWLLVLFLPIWAAGMVTSPFSRNRRGVFDMLTGVEVLYVSRYIWDVPDNLHPNSPPSPTP